jgi:hypothetical protein
MPGGEEPEKSRAPPGSLDLIEVNSAGRIASQHRIAASHRSRQHRIAHRASCIVRRLSAVVMAARLPVDR